MFLQGAQWVWENAQVGRVVAWARGGHADLGEEEVGGAHKHLSPRTGWGPGPWGGEFACSVPAPAVSLPVTESHLTASFASAPCRGQRNMTGSEVRQCSGVPHGHNLFASPFLPFYSCIYSFTRSLVDCNKMGINSLSCVQVSLQCTAPIRK